ncbi:MAG: carboxypeptidase-like regulatory domain-containing protein [Flavobacteriales bacterium]|nr:carboxypeptidase-like regulatory domain-containing protein [Flavobacteriales bacterium]
MRFLRVLLIVVFCFSVHDTCSQNEYLIKGKVKNNESIALQGASVFVKAETKDYHTITDSLGFYKVVVNSTTIRLVVRHIGYTTFDKIIELTDSNVLDIILYENVTELEEVVLAEENSRTVSGLSEGNISLSTEKMKSIPTILGVTDILKTLQLTPGVQNSGDANGYIYIRGGEQGHNLMKYESVPVYGTTHLLGLFPFYNSDHIKSVDFYKTNIKAKHGGRIGSTIVVQPENSVPSDFSVKGNIGLLASQLTVATSITPNTGVYLSGRTTYIDEVMGSLFKGNNDDAQMKYRFNDLNFTLISHINKKNSVSVNVFASGDNFSVDEEELSLNADLDWSNSLASITWKNQKNNNTSFNNTIYYSEYNNALKMNQGELLVKNKSFIKDMGYLGEVNYKLLNTELVSGIHFSAYKLNSQNIEVTNLEGVSIHNTPSNILPYTCSIFTDSKSKFTKKLSLNLGLRFNYYEALFESYRNLEPRVSLTYLLGEKGSLYLAYLQQYQYLNLLTSSSVGLPTDFWIATSSEVPPLRSNEITIGYHTEISRQYELSFAGFYRIMDNLQEYPYGLTQFNELSSIQDDLLIGAGESHGYEFLLKKNYGKYTGWLSYTLSWSNRQFEEINEGAVFPSRFDRRHNFSWVSTYSLKKVAFGFTQTFSSGNRFTTPTSWYFINSNPVKEYGDYNNSQMPNYLRSDISVTYFLKKTKVKENALNVSIYNMFNIGNPIYIFLKISGDSDNNQANIKTQNKVMYRILPSISWRFKF